MQTVHPLRVTPERIRHLSTGEVFTFGSNRAGVHGKGAAKDALKFGATMGLGRGFSGQTYALPTKDYRLNVLPLEQIQEEVETFLLVAEKSHHRFLVTAIGCGLAGYSPKQIAPMFAKAVPWEHVALPADFWQVLGYATPALDS